MGVYYDINVFLDLGFHFLAYKPSKNVFTMDGKAYRACQYANPYG